MSYISKTIQLILVTDRDLPIYSSIDKMIDVVIAPHIDALQDVLHQPSIVLFDLYSRSMDVLSMIPQVGLLASDASATFVALLAEYSDGEAIERAMSMGASGVLSASMSDEEQLRTTLLRWVATLPEKILSDEAISALASPVYASQGDRTADGSHTAGTLTASDKSPQDSETLSAELSDTLIRSALVGQSSAMREIQSMIGQIRSSDANVLITGESGTGKEVTASAIHYSSSRARSQMLSVNCGALSEHLLESELFGHVKGAFTGATTDSPGLIRAADGATLFLDEVGEMLPQTQVKLLRVLQTGELRSVGATQNELVDVRFIAATNRKLEEEIKAGRFREDLYYRLKVISIEIPPLRDRRADIPLLARVLLDKHAGTGGAQVSSFDLGAIIQLQSYAWPGNVRELENIIQQILALMPRGKISVADLPKQLFAGGVDSELHLTGEAQRRFLNFASAKKRAVSAFETDYLSTLMNYSETIAAAASMAGLDRSNFKRLLKKNGLL